MPDLTYRNLDGTGPVDWSDWDDRPRLRIVKPEPPEPVVDTHAAPEPAAAPEPVLDAPAHRDGWYSQGVWVDRPPVDPVRGLRAYLAVLKGMLDREDPKP